MSKTDLPLKPGDRVDVGFLDGCRYIQKVVERVDEEADRVFFTDGTSYHHEDHPRQTLKKELE